MILRHNSKINPNQNGMDLSKNPSPTICAQGLSAIGEYWIEFDKTKQNKTDMNKPAYKVPSMEEIRNTEWNGFKVASTFSGCGGSCTGYRMAGFKVIWANEFVPIAQESYKANADKDCFLDIRDIRTIQPEEILKQTGLNSGELDLFDGSPPCASFSTAGKREKGWGKIKKYSDIQQRTDDLFFEYSRILKGLMPKIFIAENVSGLLKGTAKGYFINILKDLKTAGYNVKCKLLDAQWLGVPQMRQRAIFIGVRNDLKFVPVYPKPLKYRYSVADAIDNLINQEINKENDISRYAIGNEWDKLKQGEKGKYFNFIKPKVKEPCSAITAIGGNLTVASVVHPTEKRKFTIDEVKRICSFPDDFILKGTYAQQWERCGRAVPPVMMFHIAKTIQTEILDKL